MESLAAFVLIILYIWDLRSTAPWTWAPTLLFIAASHLVHREGAEQIGFSLRNSRRALSELTPGLGLIALAFLGAGTLLRSIRQITFEQAAMAFAAYCPWGLLQQYLLNGYFVNRLQGASLNRSVPLISAALFAGAHAPNWFLMLVTFVGGYFGVKIYLRYRDLYFLGLAHAAVGFLIYLVVPDSITHHLRVGPGWYR